MIGTMFFVLLPFLERAPRIIINLAKNADEKRGGVLMSTILLNLKRSFICLVPVPVPVPDSRFPCFPYALSPPALQEFGITIVSL